MSNGRIELEDKKLHFVSGGTDPQGVVEDFINITSTSAFCQRCKTTVYFTNGMTMEKHAQFFHK